MNYEKDLFIDESALDVEWLEQPSLMMKYGRLEANLEFEMGRAKEVADAVKAHLDFEIRSEPEKFGLEGIKITEAVITNTIIHQETYKQAYLAFLEAKKEYDYCRVAVRAVIQRKEALENLVKLHGQMYFAGPKMPRDLNKEREDRNVTRKESNEKVRRVRRKE